MKYIINYSNDTAFNIALEEYAFKHLLDEDQIFLLWINKPSIIVGRHQNTIEEINRDYVREHGIEVVRRISGGGAVYRDLPDLCQRVSDPAPQEGNGPVQHSGHGKTARRPRASPRRCRSR